MTAQEGRTNNAAGSEGTSGNESRSNSNDDRNDQRNNRDNRSAKYDAKARLKGPIEGLEGMTFVLPSEPGGKSVALKKIGKGFKHYFGRTLERGEDTASFFDTPSTEPTLPIPDQQAPRETDGRVNKDCLEYEVWKNNVAEYTDRMKKLKGNKTVIFSTVISHCSGGVTAKLEALTEYEQASTEYDVSWLVTQLRDICNQFEKTEDRHVALFRALTTLVTYKQHATQMTSDYYDSVMDLVDVFEAYGGQLHNPAEGVMGAAELNGANADALNDTMRQRAIATLLLENADEARFSDMRQQLRSNFSRGADQYPRTANEAYQQLLSHHDDSTVKPKRRDRNRNGRGGGGRGGGGRNSGGRGSGNGRGEREVRHFALSEHATATTNHFPNGIPSNNILLDTESTTTIFCNGNMLSDIHDVDRVLHITSDGGTKESAHQQGTFPGIGKAWYGDSIGNIISVAGARRAGCRIQMDTNVSPSMFLHLTDGRKMEFTEHESGLHLYDADSTQPQPTKDAVITATSCTQTVSKNKSLYTRRQQQDADSARRLYRMMGRPSGQRFTHMLTRNHILDCPITAADANRADAIYGPDVGFLKGKTTSKPASPHTVPSPLVPVPDEILREHQTVTLCGDLMYFLGGIFTMCTSRSIRFTSIRPIANRLKNTITASVRADINMYDTRGFTVKSFHADGEYKPISPSFPAVSFNICAADDHVPEAERGVRTIKEIMRATVHGLPYKRLPMTMLKGLATFTETAMNATPHPDGVSDDISPRTIVTGKGKLQYRELKLEYGEYVQVYDGTTNDAKSRSLGAIALHPAENDGGGYYFMSLATGDRIRRTSWTSLPITDLAISRVEAIAKQDGMPLISKSNGVDEHDPNAIVDEDEYDGDYAPQTNEERTSDHEMTTDAYTSESENESDEESGNDFDDSGHHPDFDDEPSEEEERKHAPVTVETVEEEERERTDTQQTPPTEQEELFPDTDETTEEEERATNTKTTGEEERKNDTEEVPEPKREGLRPNRKRDYTHRYNAHVFAEVCETSPDADTNAVDGDLRKAITQLVFTQMSAAAGIKKHGRVAEEALMKEFKQFRDKNVFQPMQAKTLSDEQKKDALKAISVIKEKRCGKIKGRTVADGRKQRDKYTKAESTSPTVSTDALLCTLIVDAFEGRDVATADIAGAYLHADMDDEVIIRITGPTVDILCEVNPEWKDYVTYEGNTKVLYLLCNKALYGCVRSGLLWYDLFTSVLSGMGFKINPYDPCVANATIDGKQCTICWYVDDTKISHVDANVVTRILDLLIKRFGDIAITRGKIHDFLGMKIHMLDDGTFSLLMTPYLQQAIDRSELNITNESSTPASGSLLEIRDDETLLVQRRADIFHSVVATLIYVGTRARGDLLPTLSFLSGRVSSPTDNDERKLKRLLGYIKGTINEELILGADSLNTFSTWVDASFAPHMDKKSHTGGVISFGRGAICCKSQKQKINTKSSTEAELVGASDYVSNTVFIKNVMGGQGFPSTKLTFHQDNEAAEKMEKNGRSSAGQRSRHIDIRYFFITDLSKRNDINIVHCPTEVMLADFFTKPLQGSLFRKFRDVILGHKHISSLRIPKDIIPAERVETEIPVGGTQKPNATVSWADIVNPDTSWKNNTSQRSILTATQSTSTRS